MAWNRDAQPRTPAQFAGFGGVLVALLSLTTGCSLEAGSAEEEPVAEEPAANLADFATYMKPVAEEDRFFVRDQHHDHDDSVEKNHGAAGSICAGSPHRSDVVGTPFHDGAFGTWQCMDMCPANSFAYGVRMKNQSSQGSGDDTAANGIIFECYDRTTAAYTGDIYSATSSWGSWSVASYCHISEYDDWVFSSPVDGFNVQSLAPQGSGVDDVSLNNTEYHCKAAWMPTNPWTWFDGGWFRNTAPTNWGSWKTQKMCPTGSAVCGVRVRKEASQGSGDDTALNGIQVACCTHQQG